MRENRIDVVRFLLEHDCNPLGLWMDDDQRMEQLLLSYGAKPTKGHT